MLVEILWLGVLEIARIDNQVRMLGIDLVDGILENMLATLIGADMCIGKDHNPVAVEGGRQVWRGVGLLVHFQFLEPDGGAVDEDKPEQRHQTQADEVAVVFLFVE